TSDKETPAGLLTGLGKRMLALAAIAIVLVIAGGYWFSRQRSVETVQFKERQLTKNPVESPVASGAISPDGKDLAESDVRGVHVKVIEAGEEKILALPESLRNSLMVWTVTCWFPDGMRFIADASSLSKSGGIWVFSIMGSAPWKIREEGRAWSVSPDGSQIV